MAGCCPGHATAAPAVPTLSMCPNGGNFRNGLPLPGFCWSRTWQLVPCHGRCQSSLSAPGGCQPAPCQPTCLPATSCAGFVCQPTCSCTACCEPGTGQSPLASSGRPPCSGPAGGQEKCCEASPSQQSSGQGPVFVSGSRQAACGQSVRCDPRSCQPSCSEVTSGPETSCPPTGCAASPCQPTCCQAGSCHPVSGEGQPCKPTYYQPICYVFKTSQSVPCMPVPCQPSPCVFGSCNPTFRVASPCQPLHCQAAPSTPFTCQPGANCQPPCSVKKSCTPASCGTALSGQPTCGGPTSCNQSGCTSRSCQPACCVTGSGKLSGGDSNCFQPTPPHSCKASTCLPTSCQPGLEPSFCKATLS